jgi:FkbM family methyltransferase
VKELIEKISEVVARPTRNFIYDILSCLDMDLCVDIGAAAGHVTQTLCRLGGANTKVVAFEPFPGNYQFFSRTTTGLPNEITLVKKAVSDEVGTAKFLIGSVVHGGEPGWEDYAGYSSVGYLPENSLQSRLKALARKVMGVAFRKYRYQELMVETTTLDREFANETVNFVKIDVQGAEDKVLAGASEMLRSERIQMLYVEWAGDPKVIQLLADNQYCVYDSTYVVVPKVYDPRVLEDIGFRCIDEINLSTGKLAYEMVLSPDGDVPIDAIRAAKGHRGVDWIQTDLIAVSPQVCDRFLRVAKQLR